MIAQDATQHPGSIIRINLDGSIPKNNPKFKNKKDWLPEIFQIGVRNPQGLTLSPFDEKIYISNHGARGGDWFGEVKKGDLLCSSDTPGYAMKQPTEFIITSITDNGSPNNYEERQNMNSFTIGKSMQDVEFDENGLALDAGTPSWYTLNLRGGVKLGQLARLNMNIENLMNRRYRQHGSGISSPGFNLTTSLSTSF